MKFLILVIVVGVFIGGFSYVYYVNSKPSTSDLDFPPLPPLPIIRLANGNSSDNLVSKIDDLEWQLSSLESKIDSLSLDLENHDLNAQLRDSNIQEEVETVKDWIFNICLKLNVWCLQL